MQAVPSLVGTGTAVAAAAAGLVFAQPANATESAPQRPVTALPILNRGRGSASARPPSSSRPPLSRPAAKSVSYASSTPASAMAASDRDRYRNASNGSSNTASSSASSTRPPHIASSETSAAPSSTATLPRSTTPAHGGFPGSWSRRHSLILKGDWNPPPISEASRDSVSSSGSWIRRLSIRPLSQHGSPRSSVGPESPSLQFSLGSAAPIVPQPPPQQPRNKLVKRTAATQEPAATALSRRGSRSHMPTLRRPATSHQRSATLHHAPHSDESALSSSLSGRPKFSFDQQRTRPSLAVFRLGAETPEPSDQDEPREAPPTDQQGEGSGGRGSQTRWASFFHRRVTKATPSVGRGSSPFSSDNSPGGAHVSLPSRTIQVQRGQQSKAYLTRASDISSPAAPKSFAPAAVASPYQTPVAGNTVRDTVENNDEDALAVSPHGSASSPYDTPSKKARRSISMNFSSPTSWMPKTGSIRRAKRAADQPTATATTSNPNATRSPQIGSHASSSRPPATGMRHVSAPMPSSRPVSSHASSMAPQARNITAPADLYPRRTFDTTLQRPLSSGVPERGQVIMSGGGGGGRSSPIPLALDDAKMVPRRQRNSSSPLPPLSRLSSFNVDLSRLGGSSSSPLASGASPQRDYQTHASSGFATLPRSFPLVPRNRDISDERSSTLASSDLELRGFASSGDDDDTDFKSETIFDSVRTAASTRLRATDTPLESMFDESPPSTAGNSKTKRLSIQEILGQAWDSDTRIMEEDEGSSTPVRAATAARAQRSFPPLPAVVHRFDGTFSTALDRHEPVDSTEVNSLFALTTTDTDAGVSFSHANGVDFSRPSLEEEEDDDEDWAGMDDDGVTNHLSPPSRSLQNSLRGMSGLVYSSSVADGADHGASSHRRSALSTISGNGGTDLSDYYDAASHTSRERPKSNLFDWSESTVHLDRTDADGHSPRPKTVHGKQELELRNGRPANRKGPVVSHVRSQSVPVNADPTEGAKASNPKFGTWASGPKNASEDWDDDFDFGTGSSADGGGSSLDGFGSDEDDAFGQHSTVRSGKGGAASFAMVVPASIQATQPTVKAHSGQIRELSLLVDGLKRLCRHARDLHIVDEAPSLWKEAENIIALASPDEDPTEAAASKETKTAVAATAANGGDSDVPRASIEFDTVDVREHFLDDEFNAGTPNSHDDDPFDASDIADLPSTPPPPELSRTAVVRERQNVRRRSVFSPDDDIFGGGWPLAGDSSPARDAREPERPQTPERFTTATETPDSAMIESIMQAMQQQRSSSAPIRKSPVKQTSTSELFFNTNTLQELVKRANSLFHTLSDLVRRAELFTQSPAVTPRHDRLNRREDGSPAFTRVFTDPSSPSKRVPKSQSGNSVAAHTPTSLESPTPTTRVSQRLQMMTVS